MRLELYKRVILKRLLWVVSSTGRSNMIPVVSTWMTKHYGKDWIARAL